MKAIEEENLLSTEEEVSQQHEGPRGMFNDPFSFRGRIRRKEYAISVLLFYVYSTVIHSFANPILEQASIVDYRVGYAFLAIGSLLLSVPGLWFILAQGAKRCHDRDNSGWFQIIPFYGLWMLFGDGDPDENSYGPDPKGRHEYTYSE